MNHVITKIRTLHVCIGIRILLGCRIISSDECFKVIHAHLLRSFVNIISLLRINMESQLIVHPIFLILFDLLGNYFGFEITKASQSLIFTALRVL